MPTNWSGRPPTSFIVSNWGEGVWGDSEVWGGYTVIPTPWSGRTIPTTSWTGRTTVGDLVYHELTDSLGDILVDSLGYSLTALAPLSATKWTGRTPI